MIVAGLVSIVGGLLVLRYASDIALQVGGYVSPPPQGGSNFTGSGFSEGYLPIIIWGFGFTLIGSGGALLRRALMSSMGGVSGAAMMGSMMGGAGMASPELMDTYMQQALAANRVAPEFVESTSSGEGDCPHQVPGLWQLGGGGCRVLPEVWKAALAP